MAAVVAMWVANTSAGAADDVRDRVQAMVDAAVRPVMVKYRIPGMAVGVTEGGRSYVFDYGVASLETRHPVGPATLFEIGSITKTFTATLTAYAQANGRLALTDKVSKFLPSQRNSAFGELTLLALGTHTLGGIPLQVPDTVHNNDELMQYLSRWRATYAPGTYRTYANPSIGTLGLIAASRIGDTFATVMDEGLLPALGMSQSCIVVPAARMDDYAQGYTRDDRPIRLARGVLWAEAYGLRSTAADMIRFVEANMNLIALDPKLRKAIIDTHTGYFTAGPMTQDLVWEQYPFPVELSALLQGNSDDMIMNPTPVVAITPPEPPRDDVWLNKTGTTNGFAAYVAFVPAKRVGVAILANKSYPIEDRVTAAFRIVTALDAAPGSPSETGGGGRLQPRSPAKLSKH
jgi:beta-lactamase class C